MGALLTIDPYDGPLDGGHRLTAKLEQPSERWPLVAQALEADLEDHMCSLGWEPMVRLVLAGHSIAGHRDSARFYLVGSIMNWLGLASCNITPPPLQHFESVLGATPAFTLERRPLEIATYDHIVGKRPWPFRHEGCAGARRVDIEAEHGRIEAGQLRGLCRMLRAAVRRGAWAEGGLPGSDDTAILDGDTIVFPRQIWHGDLVETIYIWSQVFWVDVKVVRWTP
jgi:hypothetical protein